MIDTKVKMGRDNDGSIAHSGRALPGQAAPGRHHLGEHKAGSRGGGKHRPQRQQGQVLHLQGVWPPPASVPIEGRRQLKPRQAGSGEPLWLLVKH